MATEHDDNARTEAVNSLSSPSPGGPDTSPDVPGGIGRPIGPEATAPRQAERGIGLDPTQDLGADVVALSIDLGEPRIGPTVGPYRLLKKLGEGAFGVVYLAEQERPFRRQVALKVLKAGLGSRQLLGRFDVERQAMALMEHPNIAQVLDAGASETGRPYVVMEFVDGLPITHYCDANGLTCRQRLELLIPVCRAIQHAHQKGIIHRDLKPSNVLVTVRDGVAVPKVIDFGIAKAVGAKLTEEAQLTGFHQVMGTPAYMSPEQAALGGIDVDTRSDIYSLGVVLYELLTGTTPIPRGVFSRIRYDQLGHLIHEQDPPKPSARAGSASESGESVARDRGTDRRALARYLRGDLDWIAMKCLEKDRARRYETANGLAMDLQRHLTSEPVVAGPPGLAYRIKKFTHRHRSMVVATALLFCALTAGLAVSLFLLEAYRERSVEVLRLSDLKVLKDLEGEYEGLPRLPLGRRHDAMRGWCDRARDVLSRREWHLETLGRLRRGGTRLPDEPGTPTGEGPVGPGLAPRERYRFEDTPTQWQHDLLQQLVVEIDRLTVPVDRLARVDAWLRRTPSRQRIDDMWGRAIAAVEARHRDVRLGRQEGLYPIGQDQASGLWEFVDLNSGLEPVRDGSGSLTVGSETGVVFVLIPGGRFRMGSPEGEDGRKSRGEDSHEVEVGPFLISKYEITQAQWSRVMTLNPPVFPGPVNPVDGVSWLAAQEFCRRSGYRLPAEAQWEFACRGGTSGPYGLDRPLDDLGWYAENSDDSTSPVGQKEPNPFGLFDMHGNVLEWCRDVYEEGYYLSPRGSGRDPSNEPPEASSGQNSDRVLRGGPFNGKAEYCRCADRFRLPPGSQFKELGVRPIWAIR